jgi:SAM-dependent methyltransferase
MEASLLQGKLPRWCAAAEAASAPGLSNQGLTCIMDAYMCELQDYPLGYSELEARRLAERGALLEPLTKDVFQRAGLGPGMRVLDVGCGIGDVSLLAATMVGAQGSVLGIDRASSSVQIAERRAAALGLTRARFQVADVATFATDQVFDALVGRSSCTQGAGSSMPSLPRAQSWIWERSSTRPLCVRVSPLRA